MNRKIKGIIILLVFLLLCNGCLRPQRWIKIEGDNNTKCVHGDPYSFWVHYGTENKLIIYFQGGGVCWDGKSCSADNYNKCVECGDTPSEMTGIFDLDDDRNPFSSYNFVVIPYCTADFHWGSNLKYYWNDGEKYLINHQGFVNASYALDWVYENFSDPEVVLITGCSAGSGGSIFHAPYIINKYPDAKITQLGDSFVIFPPSFSFDSKFGALQNFPNWARRAPKDKTGISSPEFDLSQYYVFLANHYKDHKFAQFSYAKDYRQLKLYKDFDEWEPDKNTIITSNLENIDQTTTGDFSYFTLSGARHCILPTEEFLENSEFRDWMYELVEAE